MKSKKKEFWHKQIFCVNVDVFNVEVCFFINTTKEETCAWIKKNCKTGGPFNEAELDHWDANDHNRGCMIGWRGGFLVLVKADKNRFRECVGTLTHECVHVTQYLLRDRRVELSEQTEEVHAYLTEFLVTAALNNMYT